MLWLMGDVKQVTAVVSNGTARYPGCDELGQGLMMFENGTIGTLGAGWDDVANPVSLEICGTEGHATIVNGELFFQSKKVDGADGKTAWTKLPGAVPGALDAFIDAVMGKKDVPLVDVREAAYRCAVMEAMYAGARDLKWVAPQALPADK
jgi:predicted dehydrogenase